MEKINAYLGLGGGELWQIANRTYVQMMSYMIKTPNGEVVMIDGGNYFEIEAEHLYSLIKDREISAWFLTHAHDDHIGALLYLLENKDKYNVNIKKLIFNFPSEKFLEQKEDWEVNGKFLDIIKDLDIEIITPEFGDSFCFDGVSFDILNSPIIDESSSINATGIIIKAHFPKRDVLFLGDFHEQSEEEFLKKYDKDALRCDIVQMAHHGQNGVSEDFYKIISPKVCLYPAPKWLMENYLRLDDPETRGQGPFKTLETRKWMQKLGVNINYSCAEGDYIIK